MLNREPAHRGLPPFPLNREEHNEKEKGKSLD